MINKWKRKAIACGLLMAAAGMASAAADGRKLVLTGASTIAPLAAEIGKRFEKLHPGTQVDVQTGGSARGVNDARQGLSDIGMVSRDLKTDEQDLKAVTIAYDGVCMIIHKSNPVQSLTREQIIGIYKGEITNWKAIGGVDRPITVVNKAEGRSTLELFLHHFGLTNRQIKAQVVVGDNAQDIKTVVGNTGAIAYVSIGAAEFDADQGVAIKLLPMDGVKASTPNVMNRTFPLTRVLNLVTKGQATQLSQKFIDYARSGAVNDLVKDLYFVPLASAK